MVDIGRDGMTTSNISVYITADLVNVISVGLVTIVSVCAEII